MKRRDLLKTGIAAIGASTIALSGCSENKSSDIDIFSKRLSQYEFSVPLPFDYKTIDEMTELNSTIKKLQIKTLYNNLPVPAVNIIDGKLHEIRGESDGSIKTYEDFGKYVKYAQDKGFEFTYLMNSPHIIHKDEFSIFKDDFLNLLEYLHKIGVKNIKVGNNQTASLIKEFAPNEFNFQVSACYDLHNISQYKNLFDMFPDFNLIDIGHDEIHNFGLYKSLKEQFPDKKIEVLVNDRCVKGCAALASNYCHHECSKLFEDPKSRMDTFVKATYIYPWDLKYFSLMGINNFKFVAHNPYPRSNYKNISSLKKLLTIIENGYENYTWKDLADSDCILPCMYDQRQKDIKLSDIAPLFPSMKQFVKQGDRCATECKTKCNYCFNCAKKLQKVLG